MSLLKTLTINGTTYKVANVVPADSVTLLASAWVGDGDAYSQVVEIPGVTANTKVDLQPTSEQLAEFHYKILAFVAENEGGTVTVYAIGDKPTGDHTIQITKTEVEGTGKIRGNTVGTTTPRTDFNQTDPAQADYLNGREKIVQTVNGVYPDKNGNVKIGTSGASSPDCLVCEVHIPLFAPVDTTLMRPLTDLNRTPQIGEVFTAMCAKRYTVLEVMSVDQNQYAATVLASVDTGVQTVNGIAPDLNGNVVVEGGTGGTGEDGFSPVANVTQTDNGAVISITDKSGTTTATIVNGKDGKDGAQGPQGVQGEKGETGAQGVQGEKGETGAPGADGAKGDKGDTGATGAQGEPGKDGTPGKDGVSATHSWNGTTLTITSASGTSSANLKGEKGDKGDQGEQGIQGEPGADGAKGEKGDKGDKGDTGTTGSAGKDGTSVTVKSVSESTADGGSNVVTFSDGKTVTIKNGSKGSTGSKGDKGDKGDTGAAGAAGTTPVKGKDYYTDEDKAEFTNYLAAELAKRGQLKPEFANSIEECTDTTKLYVLPDGMIYAYMLIEKEVETGGGYTNLLPLATDTDRKTIYGEDYDVDGNSDGYLKGQRLSSSGGLSALASACVSGFIPASEGDVLRIKNTKPIPTSTSAYVITYNSSNTKVAHKSLGTTSDFSDWATPASTPYVTYTDGVLIIPLTSENFGTGFNAIRFSAGTIDETSIVTINEEIVEGGKTEIVTEYAWVSTGLAFVPADYEHRYDIFDYAYIKNGELVANALNVTGNQHGHYTGVKMDARIKRIMCKAKLTANASVVLISTNLGSSVVANIVRGSIHLIFNVNGCSVGIYDSGVGTLRNVVQYACSTAEDTEVAFGYAVDESTNTMTVYLPDGTTKTLTDNALGVVNGQYAIWEHYCNSASAGFKCCRMTKLWCEDADGNVLDDDMKRLDGAIGVAPTGQVYRQFRTGQQTNRDFA